MGNHISMSQGTSKWFKTIKKSSVAYFFFCKICCPYLDIRGPASFIMPLQIGKTPIVVPRQHQFNEHVNDHQVEFARNVAQRKGTIIPVEDINTLGDIITNYDQIVAGMRHGMSSNNARFNEELEKIVEKMMEEKNDSEENSLLLVWRKSITRRYKTLYRKLEKILSGLRIDSLGRV